MQAGSGFLNRRVELLPVAHDWLRPKLDSPDAGTMPHRDARRSDSSCLQYILNARCVQAMLGRTGIGIAEIKEAEFTGWETDSEKETKTRRLASATNLGLCARLKLRVDFERSAAGGSG